MQAERREASGKMLNKAPASLPPSEKEDPGHAHDLRACALQILAWYTAEGSSVVEGCCRGGFGQCAVDYCSDLQTTALAAEHVITRPRQTRV